MPTAFSSLRPRFRLTTLVPTVLALTLAVGWASREAAFAREKAELVASQTVTLDQVSMSKSEYNGRHVGDVGLYVQGDTPGSTQFVTGRYILKAGETPHAPHKHVEEEVMVIEKGQGEIYCDGKTTKVGPGSVMYTTPMAEHGIVNTGVEPLTFYFVKWNGRGTDGN